MARAYFIGGAPRVGKSTLALKLQECHPIVGASTDALRATLRGTVTPVEKPELFYLDSLNADEAHMADLMLSHTKAIIAAADRESEAVWPTIEYFVHQHISAGRDVLVEGVAVLASLIKTLNVDYSVVHLGNQSSAQGGIIQAYAATHPDTWLGTLQPATVAAFAHFCQMSSVHVQKQAETHDQPYIEMSNQPFPDSVQLALMSLDY